MGKPMYQLDEDIRRVDHNKWPKRLVCGNYLSLKKMTFQTRVVGYRAEIIRESDGQCLAKLYKNGKITVFPGYYWDGPSGPTVDTVAFVIASLPHDIFYQMLREDLLIDVSNYVAFPEPYYEEFEKVRRWADDTMREVNIKNGMTKFRAYYTYKFVRWYGEESALSRYVKDYNEYWMNHG